MSTPKPGSQHTWNRRMHQAHAYPGHGLSVLLLLPSLTGTGHKRGDDGERRQTSGMLCVVRDKRTISPSPTSRPPGLLVSLSSSSSAAKGDPVLSLLTREGETRHISIRHIRDRDLTIRVPVLSVRSSGEENARITLSVLSQLLSLGSSPVYLSFACLLPAIHLLVGVCGTTTGQTVSGRNKRNGRRRRTSDSRALDPVVGPFA